jgi:hypothetical protein
MKRRAIFLLAAILATGCAKTKYPDHVRDEFKRQLEPAGGWHIEQWSACDPAKSSYSVKVSHKSAEHGTHRFHVWAHSAEPTVDLLRQDNKTIWLTVETWKRPISLTYLAKMPHLSAEEEAYLRDLIEQVTSAFQKAIE